MATSQEIAKAKLARRIKTDAYDTQIADLLDAAELDLGVAGVEIPSEAGLLVQTAKITYFLMHFGEPENYDQLKASYDEQKAQLATCTGFTNWEAENG